MTLEPPRPDRVPEPGSPAGGRIGRPHAVLLRAVLLTVLLGAGMFGPARPGLSGSLGPGSVRAQDRPDAASRPPGSGSVSRRVSIRAWRFDTLDSAYVAGALPHAPGYGVNTVLFAPEAATDLHVGDADSESAPRARALRILARRASSLGLRVWLAVREPTAVPAGRLAGDRLRLEGEAPWSWLEDRYDRLLADHPELDALVLTVRDTAYGFLDPETATATSHPERFAGLVAALHRACERYDRRLVVRTALERAEELARLREAFSRISSEVAVQSRAVPGRGQPYHPHNPAIGAFPGRRQIVSFDASAASTGLGRIPYTSPSHVLYRWRYALQYGEVTGYAARVAHGPGGRFEALYGPNAIDLFALARLSEDSTVAAGQIWTEWTTRRYGMGAAPHVQAALEPSFEAVNRAFFPLEFTLTDRSRLPRFAEAEAHLATRSPARWTPKDRRYRLLEERLGRPDPGMLERILAEKDTAVTLADRALLHLRRARPHLTDGSYADLEERLLLMQRVVEIWRLHAEAFFGYRVLAEGHRVPGLARRVERAIAGLRREARTAEASPRFADTPPGRPERVRAVAAELDSLLEGFLTRRRGGDPSWTGRPWPRHTIDASSRGADGTRLADANGDGLPDVTTGWEEGGLVRTYLHPGRERVRGAWTAITVGRTRSVEDAHSLDLDGDGRLDVISAAEGEDRTLYVHWAPPAHRAYGDSSAWSGRPVTGTQDRMQWMFTAPIRVGGTLQLAAGGKNAGAQVGLLRLPADARRTADWSWHPLTEAGWIMSLLPVDLDGDGDEDLLLSDRRGPMRGVRWIEQPGPETDAPTGWRNHHLGGRGSEVMFLDRGDATGDGRADVVAATRSDTLLLFRRIGGENEGDASDYARTAIRLPADAGTAKAVAVGEVDGDGRPDLVVSCENAEGRHGVLWLRHEEDAPWSAWTAHPISGLPGTKFDLVRLRDLDGDGDLDVITSEEREQLGVLWYENPAHVPPY